MKGIQACLAVVFACARGHRACVKLDLLQQDFVGHYKRDLDGHAYDLVGVMGNDMLLWVLREGNQGKRYMPQNSTLTIDKRICEKVATMVRENNKQNASQPIGAWTWFIKFLNLIKATETKNFKLFCMKAHSVEDLHSNVPSNQRLHMISPHGVTNDDGTLRFLAAYNCDSNPNLIPLQYCGMHTNSTRSFKRLQFKAAESWHYTPHVFFPDRPLPTLEKTHFHSLESSTLQCIHVTGNFEYMQNMLGEAKKAIDIIAHSNNDLLLFAYDKKIPSVIPEGTLNVRFVMIQLCEEASMSLRADTETQKLKSIIGNEKCFTGKKPRDVFECWKCLRSYFYARRIDFHINDDLLFCGVLRSKNSTQFQNVF